MSDEELFLTEEIAWLSDELTIVQAERDALAKICRLLVEIDEDDDWEIYNSIMRYGDIAKMAKKVLGELEDK